MRVKEFTGIIASVPQEIIRQKGGRTVRTLSRDGVPHAQLCPNCAALFRPPLPASPSDQVGRIQHVILPAAQVDVEYPRMEPRIQHAPTEDGVSIAYWTLGEGAPLVVMPSANDRSLHYPVGSVRWVRLRGELRRLP